MASSINGLPFKLEVGTKSKYVKSPVNGNKILLTPEAVAVYDYILGTQVVMSNPVLLALTQLQMKNEPITIIESFTLAIDWFIKYHPEAYKALLD